MSSLPNDTEDFPRGGSGALSPLEIRRVTQEAEKDILFGSKTETKKKKKSKTPKKTVESKDKQDDDEVNVVSKITSVEPLSYKKLCEGMLILGCIREISVTEIIVNLPNSLNGYIPITSINQSITDELGKDEEGNELEKEDDTDEVITNLHALFHPGQYIPTAVIGLDSSKHGYRKIKLSINPVDVNSNMSSTHLQTNLMLWGFVTGIEDHGSVVSFGLKGVSGFLPKSDLGDLKVGHMQWFRIDFVSSGGRVLKVSAQWESVRKSQLTNDMNPVFSNLRPGILVKGSVTQVFKHGISVSFYGFNGMIDSIHLNDHGGGDSLDEIYRKKKKVKGRIVHVNPTVKTVGMTLLEDIVEFTEEESIEDTIGQLDTCTVIRADSNKGLLIELSDGRKGYVHISRVADEKIEKLGKKYKAGSTHECRILGFNGMDKLFIITLEKSVIDLPFLRYQDIKPGMVVSGTIITLEDFGMLVKLADHIRGLCPKLHLADIILKHPEKKLKDGKQVKCRVLNVIPKDRRLTLTHKKSLVNSELPILTSYEEASRGIRVQGYVSGINDHGLIIRFYNFVKGFMPRSELSLQPDEHIQQAFYKGQVITCTVMSCNPETKKMKLTLKLKEEMEKKVDRTSRASIGDIFTGKVEKISPSGVDVRLDVDCVAFLSKEQLSDFRAHQDALHFIYEKRGKDSEISSNLLCLGQNKNKMTVLSTKKSLHFLATKNHLISKFSDLKPGLVTVGYVSHLMSYGIFVEISPGIVGLVPNSHLADQYVSDPSTYFSVGQSLVVKVTEIDEDKHRFLITSKPSELESEDDDNIFHELKGIPFLQFVLDERMDICDQLRSLPDGPVKQLSSAIGTTVTAKVMSVKADGVRLKTEDNVNGFLPKELREGVDVESGDVVQCYVVDIDMKNWLFIGSILPEIMDALKLEKKKKRKLKIGQEAEAVVRHLTNDYVVATFPKNSHAIGYIPAKENMNDIRDVSKRYYIGQRVKGIVECIRSYGPLLRCEDVFEGGRPKIGATVNAVITSIKSVQINVSLKGTNIHGRVHISEVWDDIREGVNPFAEFKPGEVIRCKIIGFRDYKTQKYLPISHPNLTKALAELSMRPSVLSGTTSDVTETVEFKNLENYRKNDSMSCYVRTVMFTLYRIVKRGVAESVPDKPSVHTRNAAFEAVSARKQYCSAPLLQVERSVPDRFLKRSESSLDTSMGVEIATEPRIGK